MEDTTMKKTTRSALALFALLVGALSYTAAAYACDGGHHDSTRTSDRFASFRSDDVFRYRTTLTSPDTGTCSDNVWANDTIKRTYIVKKNSDGSFRLTAFDRGSFVTVAGQSPEACNTANPRHGSTVTAGIAGRFGGFLTENITGGTFNPHATCAAECNRAAFVAAFFGASAQQNLDKNVKYLFVYMSKDPALKYHVWLDSGRAGSTGGLVTHDRGDIATA
jgi:hypothetical protein